MHSHRKRTLSLPEAKLSKLKACILTWQTKRKATKKELKSLIGRLNWASRVVRGGRTFLRRLIDLMCGVKKPHHHIRLSVSSMADLAWWGTFMESFNGVVQFIASDPLPVSMFSTDACGTGGAAVYNSDWLYCNWVIDDPQISELHINLKELYTVLLSARRWACDWRNKHIVIWTDSQVTMFNINKGSSRNKCAMYWLRELFWLSAYFNFFITSRHIAGKDNWLSDYISRLQEHSDWRDKIVQAGLDINLPLHMSNQCFYFLQEV